LDRGFRQPIIGIVGWQLDIEVRKVFVSVAGLFPDARIGPDIVRIDERDQQTKRLAELRCPILQKIDETFANPWGLTASAGLPPSI